MAVEIKVDPNEQGALLRVKGALKRKAKALKQIGVLGESEAQRAFADQSFGAEFPWAERYPNQSEPFMNIAGALADFSAGRDKPKARRMDRRPAVIDTSNLRSSISHEIKGDDTVEWGTTVPYAANHQFGIASSQTITKSAKQAIAKWLLTPEGVEFRPKMLPLLQPLRRTWDTDIVQRPFLGVHPRMEEDIVSIVERTIAEEAASGES